MTDADKASIILIGMFLFANILFGLLVWYRHVETKPFRDQMRARGLRARPQSKFVDQSDVVVTGDLVGGLSPGTVSTLMFAAKSWRDQIKRFPRGSAHDAIEEAIEELRAKYPDCR